MTDSANFIWDGTNLGVGTATPTFFTTPARVFEVSYDGDGFPVINLSRMNGVTKTNSQWSIYVGSTGALAFRDITNARNPMVFDENGRMGVGQSAIAAQLEVKTFDTTVPTMKLQALPSQTANLLEWDATVTGVDGADGVINNLGQLGLRVAIPRGTFHAQLSENYDLLTTVDAFTIVRKAAAIASSTALGRLQFVGTEDSYATSFVGSEIRGSGDGTWTATSSPGRIDFYTTPAGSTALVEVGRFTASGNLLIGTTTETAGKLQVTGDAYISGKLGIGGITPTRRLDLLATGVTSGTDDQLRLTSARAAITTNNLIGGLEFVSNDTSLTVGSQTLVSYIRTASGGEHSATSLPTYMTFGVTNSNAIVPVEMMRINATSVLVGTTAVTNSQNFFEVKKNTVDANLHVIVSTGNTSATTNTSMATKGIVSQLTHAVSSGYTNSGSVYGIYSQNFRNGTESVDSGTLKTQTGGLFLTGHDNTGAGSPVTTTSTALDAITYLQSGSITTLYGLRVRVWGNTTTVTNRWGISQEDTLAKNYFGGDVLIGSTTATSGKLQVTGAIYASTTVNAVSGYQVNGVTALSTGVVNLGSGNTVSGALMASAIGYYCKATGGNSLATGYYCEASSDRGIAMGSSSKATEALGIAIGAECVASGIRSMVLGSKANANGKQACFVWSDEVGCSAPDDSTFSVQATNGAFFSNYVSAVSGYKVNATTFIDSTSFSINLINATAPTVHTDNSIQIFSTDTGDATATLGLLLEQQIEAIGTFTASHKIKVNINGANYWLQLDAV